MSLLLPIKRQITPSFLHYLKKIQRGYFEGWFELYEYIYVPAQLTKDKLLLHHIDTLTEIDVTRRRLVGEASRRSSDLILKESSVNQVLLPTMHEIVDDGQDVLCFCRYPRNLIIFPIFTPSLLIKRKSFNISSFFVIFNLGICYATFFTKQV